MCELFGLSASQPISAREMPLAEFRARGGLAADNPDGWGIAWREAGRLLLVKEPFPACDSAEFAKLSASLCSDLVIAHVRKARFPPVNNLNNTHPFLRQCCGKNWVFAHNGLVPDVVAMEQSNQERICLPEGETDSEFAFCHLLSHVALNFSEVAAGWQAVLGKISDMIALHGKFNFLMSDGECLIAYGHDRLHYQERVNASGALSLVATEPLTDPIDWTPFAAGELRIYRAGVLVAQLPGLT